MRYARKLSCVYLARKHSAVRWHRFTVQHCSPRQNPSCMARCPEASSGLFLWHARILVAPHPFPSWQPHYRVTFLSGRAASPVAVLAIWGLECPVGGSGQCESTRVHSISHINYTPSHPFIYLTTRDALREDSPAAIRCLQSGISPMCSRCAVSLERINISQFSRNPTIQRRRSVHKSIWLVCRHIGDWPEARRSKSTHGRSGADTFKRWMLQDSRRRQLP
jgi:hypothetical protein